MAKLVVFYSRADENYFGGQHRYIKVGNTEKAAKTIAQITGADLFKIEQKVPYAADYNTCVAEARKDFQENARPELMHRRMRMQITQLPLRLQNPKSNWTGKPRRKNRQDSARKKTT